MYILVRAKDNMIVASAARRVDEVSASKNGYRVYEVDDSEFDDKMIGSYLQSFEREGR